MRACTSSCTTIDLERGAEFGPAHDHHLPGLVVVEPADLFGVERRVGIEEIHRAVEQSQDLVQALRHGDIVGFEVLFDKDANPIGKFVGRDDRDLGLHDERQPPHRLGGLDQGIDLIREPGDVDRSGGSRGRHVCGVIPTRGGQKDEGNRQCRNPMHEIRLEGETGRPSQRREHPQERHSPEPMPLKRPPGGEIVTRIKFIAALTALTIVVGAVPALADEAGEDEDEASAQLDHDSPLALLLAVEFGIAVESVADLRDMGLGFGDIFKLTTLSTVLGVEVDALLASALVNPETGEYEFAWGDLKKTLTEEQLALLASFPKTSEPSCPRGTAITAATSTSLTPPPQNPPSPAKVGNTGTTGEHAFGEPQVRQPRP